MDVDRSSKLFPTVILSDNPRVLLIAFQYNAIKREHFLITYRYTNLPQSCDLNGSAKVMIRFLRAWTR